MQRVTLASDVDWEGWLKQATFLVFEGCPPEQVLFTVEGEATLLAKSASPVSATAVRGAPAAAFLELGRRVICHRAADRFDLLYRTLWRLRATPALMEIASYPDVARLAACARAVRRDRHKMTAFVRFQETPDGAGYMAWFEPEHRIEEDVASFFVDRYAAMRFAIHTPRRAILWDGARLSFGPGGKPGEFAKDAFSQAWNVYYRSIFNPARLNTAAMKKEMPLKYWANLPETQQIPDLIASVGKRLRAFDDTFAQPVERRLRRPETPQGPDDTLATCRRCALWRDATQAVPGEGPPDAAIVFVGEQPGDLEDLAGRPFVGPAGEVFDAALRAAGLDRRSCYVTNAVKHFKHEPRGKKRLHRRPVEGEIVACRTWLAHELDRASIRVVVALGATAYFALTGRRDFAEQRGGEMTLPDGRRLVVTTHPAYLLRIPDAALERQERAAFLAAIRRAAELRQAEPSRV